MTKDMPDHLVWILTETISDGSKVFNVEFEDIKIPAVTRLDAEQLAQKIVDAINAHSVSTADVMD